MTKKGCGQFTHVAGTNGGRMPCGARLTGLSGKTAPYYCGECEPAPPYPLTLYARREPTTDSVLRQHEPKSKRTDVVFYKDKEATTFYARWVWHYRPPTRRARSVVLNCFRWNLVWLGGTN